MRHLLYAAGVCEVVEQHLGLKPVNPHWSPVLQLMMAFVIPVIYGLILYTAAFVIDHFTSLQ